jgi:Secretion system C-terminal sorting domain
VFQVNGTAPQYTAVYNYNGNPFVTPSIESDLRLNKRADNAAASWTLIAAVSDEPNNTITVTGESTEYILGRLTGSLPLNLLSFSGSKQNNDALLQWKTANEVGVNKFEVQRSNDGQIFTTFGTVAAGGTLYSLTDYNTFSSRTVAFYRLKSIDADDRFTYSNIIKLSKQTSAAVTVFPTPVCDLLTINGLKQNGTVLLYSAEGKLLQQQIVFAQTITMDMSKYARGMYLLQYKTGDELMNQKIIKQ